VPGLSEFFGGGDAISGGDAVGGDEPGGTTR
jgi:hypothetical protein